MEVETKLRTSGDISARAMLALDEAAAKGVCDGWVESCDVAGPVG